MGFRWYGDGNDTVTLDQVRQIPGVEVVESVNLHESIKLGRSVLGLSRDHGIESCPRRSSSPTWQRTPAG